MIGKPESEARAIYDQYDRELPFVAQLVRLCQNTAARRAISTLYDGARRHWTIGRHRRSPGRRAPDRARARKPSAGIADPEASLVSALDPARRYPQGDECADPGLGRAAYEALDARVLARRHRPAPADARLPRLLGGHAGAGRARGAIVREAVKLEVPMRVDLKFGRNWGDAKHTWEVLTGTAPAPKQEPVVAAKLQPTTPKINGTEVHVAVAQAPIELPKKPEAVAEEMKAPLLVDLVDQPLVDGKICCPFHDDSTPSCHIYPDHFYCFGCGAHGDAIDWLMMFEGLDRDAGDRRLANWRGHRARTRAGRREG